MSYLVVSHSGRKKTLTLDATALVSTVKKRNKHDPFASFQVAAVWTIFFAARHTSNSQNIL